MARSHAGAGRKGGPAKGGTVGLSIIGAGLPRTGTTTLKAALERLGIGPCYHMVELFPRPEHPPLWVDAAAGRPVDWDALLDGFAATTDAPGCYFYRELAAHYPAAKVILTVRDPDRWFLSTQSTILSEALSRRFSDAPPALGEMLRRLGWHPDDPQVHERAPRIAHLQAHEAAVRAAIAPDRLLVYEVAQGWAPLCAFLGLEVPDMPFPHLNSTDDFREMIARRAPLEHAGEHIGARPGNPPNPG